MDNPKGVAAILAKINKPRGKKKVYCHYLDVALYNRFLKIISKNVDTKSGATRLASPTMNYMLEKFVEKYEK